MEDAAQAPVPAPLVTVLTATHDRAHLLGDLYQSLSAQTFADFEWLVVDDGSTDGTAEVVRSWSADAAFPIRCVRQEHSGVPVALNRGIREARGAYVAVIDSDDCYLPGGLETLVRHIEGLPPAESAEFANVEARAVSASGALIGTPLPQPVVDADNFSAHEAVALGDTLGIYRTEVRRQFPFPEDLGRFVPEALVWNRIARTYRTRFVSDVVGVKRFQAGGLSARSTATRVGEALAYRTFYRELLTMPRPMRLATRLRAYVGYTKCCLHLRQPLRTQAHDAPAAGWWLMTLPAGVAAWARDRWRVRRSQR